MTRAHRKFEGLIYPGSAGHWFVDSDVIELPHCRLTVVLKPGPEVIKPFSCSTQLSMKFQLLIKPEILTNEEVSYFKSLRCFIFHAYKC